MARKLRPEIYIAPYPWLSPQVLSLYSLLFSFLPPSPSSKFLVDDLSSCSHYPVSQCSSCYAISVIPDMRCIHCYYLDRSFKLKTKTLFECTNQYIRDSSGVFSCEWHIANNVQVSWLNELAWVVVRFHVTSSNS